MNCFLIISTYNWHQALELVLVSVSKQTILPNEIVIADDGSILISSNQVAEKKLDELPGDIIILAKTDQLINNISEGLSGIKNNSKSIPSNITNLKHFKDCNDKDFLSYGSSSKNLYLLLLEDL